MTAGQVVFIIGISLLLLGIATFLVVIAYRRTRVEGDIPEDATLVLNFMTRHTAGYALGLQTGSLDGQDGRQHVVFVPRDIVPAEDAAAQEVVVDKGFKLDFPRGTLSKRRNVTFLLPKKIEELPKSLQDNEMLGAAITASQIKQRVDNRVTQLLEAGMDAQADLIRRNTSNKFFKDYIDYMEKRVQNLPESKTFSSTDTAPR